MRVLSIYILYQSSKLLKQCYSSLVLSILLYGCARPSSEIVAFPDILDFGAYGTQKTFMITFNKENVTNDWLLNVEGSPPWLYISPITGSGNTIVSASVERNFLGEINSTSNILIEDSIGNKCIVKVSVTNTIDSCYEETCTRTDIQGKWYIFIDTGDLYEESGYMVFNNGNIGIYGTGIYFNERGEIIERYSLGNLGTYTISPNSKPPHNIDIMINQVREQMDNNVYTENSEPVILRGIYAFDGGNLILAANGIGWRPRSFQNHSQVWARMIEESEIYKHDFWNGEDLYDYSLD